MSDDREITRLLAEADAGRDGAIDELMGVVYVDLERMARSHLHRQFGDRVDAITLEPAALVNEFFLKLIRQRSRYDNRGHFFAIATRIMLRVLIDYARQRDAAKRGGQACRITLALDEQPLPGAGAQPATELIEVGDLVGALERLEALDHRKADVVRLRVIWGLDIAETARALTLSKSTVDRDWRFAKAWLADELGLTGS